MMGDIIYIIAYMATELCNYLLAYTVIFGVGVTKRKRTWIITIIGVMCFHIFLLFYIGIGGASAMSMFSMLVIPIVLLRPVEKKNFLLYLFVVIGTSVLVICGTFIIAYILGVEERTISEESWLIIVCQLIPCTGIILLWLYKRFKGGNNYVVNLSRKQYVLFYTVIICTFFMIAPVQKLASEASNQKWYNVIGISASVACIVLVIVTLWQGIVVNREIQLKERNQMYEKYMKLQKEYYDNLVEQDERMRRFRHDMRAHIAVMSSYCNESSLVQLRDYLDTIVIESAINENKAYTGNKEADAVIGQLVEEAQKKRIYIKTTGRLPEKIQVSAYDLCTIISNLLKNAMEACEVIEDMERKNVYLEVGTLNSQIYIMVKNEICEEVIVNNNDIITTKADKRNHGLGIRNVKESVGKYGGVLEIHCESGWFYAEVNI